MVYPMPSAEKDPKRSCFYPIIHIDVWCFNNNRIWHFQKGNVPAC
jgi:hypothetical protein